jgi:hypothetical protein
MIVAYLIREGDDLDAEDIRTTSQGNLNEGGCADL